jgi:hypothetical protein
VHILSHSTQIQVCLILYYEYFIIFYNEGKEVHQSKVNSHNYKQNLMQTKQTVLCYNDITHLFTARRKLRVYENKVQRRIFGPKMEWRIKVTK